MYIPSVSIAASKILKCYGKNDIDGLSEVKKYLENNNVAESIAGDGDEFHNATVSLTRGGFYDYAYALAKVGSARHPRNTDLLGDLLCYGLHCRSLDELQIWYDKLESINKRFWTWRAYQFSFDYWMARIPYASNDQEMQKWEDNIEHIIAEFKNNFRYLKDKSDCEKVFMMEYEYYSSKGDEKRALDALESATTNVNTKNKCAQCALKLADRYFEVGDYANAYKYAKVATSIKEDQPSINLGYTYYILAMALEWKEKESHSISQNIKFVYDAYHAAYLHLSIDRENLLVSVKMQVQKLEYEFGVSSNIPFDKMDKDKESGTNEFIGFIKKSMTTE